MRINDKKVGDNFRSDTMGTNVYSSKDNQSMHKSLNGEFLLYQILIEQILNGNKSLNSSQTTLNEYFQPDDSDEQKLLKEYDQEYQSSKAIYWYTKESPIYKILNKALRTQNIDHLIPFSNLIKDLDQQLSKEQIQFIEKQKTTIIKVYRGQLISKDELNRLKTTVGQLISMNSFLSTSTKKKKALEFATSRPPPNDQLTSILIKINVHLNQLTKPYADIKHLSAFPDEEEILFMFGSIFRIDKIYFHRKKNVWIAKLTMASENDQDYKDYSENLKKQFNGQNQFISIGNYFIQMQKYEEAQEHFQHIFQNNIIDDPTEMAFSYYGLADVLLKKGDYHSTITNLNQLLQILLNNPLTKDHQLISQSYNQLALANFKLNNYLIAFQFYEKALNTPKNISSTSYQGLAEVHFKLNNHFLALEYLDKAILAEDKTNYALIGNIFIQKGQIFAAMNNKDKASEMFDKAIESQLKFLPANHPDLSYTYSALGLMYSDLNDQDKAFEFIQKSYQLQLEYLPNNHLDFAQTYKDFAYLYMKKEDLDQSLIYYHLALENQLKTFLWNHPSVAETYFDIGSVYRKKKDYDKTLVYYHKIVDSELSRSKPGDQTLTIAFENLANVYYEKGDEDQALIYYHKQLENELLVKLDEDISLADLYKIIGTIYNKKCVLKEALLYYNRLLDCHLRKDGYKGKIVEDIYQLIGNVYLKKSDLSGKLLYYERLQVTTAEDVEKIYFEKRHLDEALTYYEKCLEEELKNCSEDNPLVNDKYSILGNIYYEKGDLDRALDTFVKLFNNQSKGKTLINPSLSNLYKIVGEICYSKEYYDQSLICFNRLIDCQLSVSRFDDPIIIKTYEYIGNIYLKKDSLNQISNYVKTLIDKKSKKNQLKIFETDFRFEKRHLEDKLIYFRNFSQRKSSKPFKRKDILRIIANLFLEKQDFSQALLYFQQLLSYQNRKHPFQYQLLGKTNEILANIYQKELMFTLALQHYRQSLYFYQKISPSNQILIDHLKHQINEINKSNI